MRKTRATISMLLLAPVILVASGCANSRLPAIDPSGQRIFLPSPNYTTIAPDGPFGRFLRRGPGAGAEDAVIRAPGPYEPALLNRPRQALASHFRRDGRDGGVFQDSGIGTDSAFPTPALPPLCGPDGLAPDGGPCYPVGSPIASSLAATLPGAIGRVGSGVARDASGSCGLPQTLDGSGIPLLAGLGPGVFLARPEMVAPIGEEVVVVGGVRSTSGVMRPGEAVQWTLSNDSVGTIVDAAGHALPGRSSLFGFLHRAGTSMARGCGNCVTSTTAARGDVLPRNPIDPNDDIYLSRGQTWVSLTSGSEGISYVTLAAPQLQGRRQATAAVIWIDARVHYPRPVLSSLEGPAQLITQTVRRSSAAPLANWIVRYTVLEEGLDARLNQAGDRRLDVPTDVAGRAIVNVYPNTGEQGTTRIGIEVFKPEDSAAGRRNIRVGQCIGYVTWSESEVAIPPAFPPTDLPALPPTADSPTRPQQTQPIPLEPAPSEPATGTLATERTSLSIEPNGPPEATIGDIVTYRITVGNTGNAEAKNVIVSTSLPDAGLQFIDSDQQHYSDQREIYWQLGNLAVDQTATLTARFRVTDAGNLRNVFFAQAVNANEVTNWIRTTVIREALSIDVSRPEPFSPRVGETINFEIVVTNNTDRPINATLSDYFDPGMEAVGAGGQTTDRPIERSIYLPPGPSDPISLQFVAREPGTYTHRVEVEGYPAQAVGTVTVLPAPTPPAQPSLTIAEIRGPSRMQAGSVEQFTVTVLNDGDTTLTGVRIDYQFNADLLVVRATGGYQPMGDGSILAWSIRDQEDRPVFPPNTSVRFQLELRASESPSVTRPRNTIRVTSDQDVGDEAYLEVEIIENEGATPGFDGGARNDDPGKLTALVQARPDSVLPNEPIEYLVTLRNESSQSFREVYVTVQIAEKMQFSAPGSGPPGTRATEGSNGLLMQFSAVREIRPGEELAFRVQATASVSGTARMLARVEATQLATPLIVGKETEVK